MSNINTYNNMRLVCFPFQNLNQCVYYMPHMINLPTSLAVLADDGIFNFKIFSYNMSKPT